MKYTLSDLLFDFPTEVACLTWLFHFKYPDGKHCIKCDRITKHYPLQKRKIFSCGNCGHHISPLVGTIFQNSHIALRDWFYAIYLMATNKAGTSAKQIERELGVTYKTAWRMMHQIRKLMANPSEQLAGQVEIDETFLHPNVYKRSSARKHYGRTGQRTGEIIFGMVERGGKVKVFHVRSTGERVLTPIIREHIKRGSLIHSDGWTGYKRLPNWGYGHRTTNHGIGQYYTKDSYTQNIENVWSHFKRGIKGVYRHIDKNYVQAYASEYAWRYSHRNDVSMFWSLMSKVV